MIPTGSTRSSDGFRALAVIEHGHCRFFSRKKHRLTGYGDLREALNAENAILDGIVAKRANSPYEDNTETPHWVKIKNPKYSQKEGRADLFKRAG